MNINLTLVGQMITFAVFVWFTMKFVWPPVTTALEDRRKKVADGLAAGERGEKELELAQAKSVEQLRTAKQDAAKILEQANQRADQIVVQAQQRAQDEGQRIAAAAQADIEKQKQAARDALRKETAQIAVNGAEQILGKEMDAATNNAWLEKLARELS